MGNPRKFSRIGRQLALRKPVIVVKSGISSYSVPPGHEARATRVPPAAFDAMLRQAGVIRVENVHQLFDVAQLLVHQPLPRGGRVGIVGNSNALGALTAEACVSWGLEITHGPVCLPAEATSAEFTTALEAAFEDEGVDSVLTCFTPPLVTSGVDVAHAVVESAGRSEKPCVSTFLGMRGVTAVLSGQDREVHGDARAVPAYPMPEDAVRSLVAATRYGQWRARDRGELVNPSGVNREAVERIVERILADAPAGRALEPTEAQTLLAAYGVELWPTIAVETADDAVAAAQHLGYPIVLKSTSPTVRHQPGLAGIRLDLGTEASVRESFETLSLRLSPLHADAFVVQRMGTPGVACVVRTAEDSLFG